MYVKYVSRSVMGVGKSWPNLNCQALPYMFRKPALYALERLLLDPLLRMVLKDSAAKLGMPLPSRIASQWQYSPEKILGLFYGWFSPPPDDWPSQITLTGFPLFSESMDQQSLGSSVKEFLDSGSPPIIFTLGTRVKNCRAFFNTALEALQQLDQRGIFLTRAADQIPDLPVTVLYEKYLPLQMVLLIMLWLLFHSNNPSAPGMMRRKHSGMSSYKQMNLLPVLTRK